MERAARSLERQRHGEVPGRARTSTAGGIGVTLAQHVGAARVLVPGNPNRHAVGARDHGAGEGAADEQRRDDEQRGGGTGRGDRGRRRRQAGGQREDRERRRSTSGSGCGRRSTCSKDSAVGQCRSAGTRPAAAADPRSNRTPRRQLRRYSVIMTKWSTPPALRTGIARQLGRSPARPLHRRSRASSESAPRSRSSAATCATRPILADGALSGQDRGRRRRSPTD